MTKNQFFYLRKELVQPVVKGKEKYKSFRSSFNIEKIVRSEELDNGNVVVLLDDIHQRPIDVEVKNKMGNTAIKREMNTFQSEIYLTEADDIEEFYALTNAKSSLELKYDSKLTSHT